MQYYPKTQEPSSFNETKTLSELANELETDKGTADASTLPWNQNFPLHKCWHYTTIYEKYMDPVRLNNISLLEIGICDHRFPFASPKMWLQYFKSPTLYCVDNFWGQSLNQINVNMLNELGANFIYADQSNENDWKEIQQLLHNKIDFLVEDGSHLPPHMMLSLYHSIPILKPGAFYFMEDIATVNGHSVWLYNNEIYNELLNFQSTNILSSTSLSSDQNITISNSFKLLEIFTSPHNLTHLAVFQKL